MRTTCYGFPLTGQSIPGVPWRTPGSVACARAALETEHAQTDEQCCDCEMNRRVVQALG
jgi:hypothetical protein